MLSRFDRLMEQCERISRNSDGTMSYAHLSGMLTAHLRFANQELERLRAEYEPRADDINTFEVELDGTTFLVELTGDDAASIKVNGAEVANFLDLDVYGKLQYRAGNKRDEERERQNDRNREDFLAEAAYWARQAL